MAQRKPIVIDGAVKDVSSKSTITDLVPREVMSVVTNEGKLIPRSHFSQVPLPDGFETNLNTINKG